MNILTTGRTFTPPTMAPLANDLSLAGDTILPDIAAEGDLSITAQYPGQTVGQFSFSHAPVLFNGRSLRIGLLDLAAEHSFAIKAVIVGAVLAAGLVSDPAQTTGFEITPVMAGLGSFFGKIFGGGKTATSEPPDWKIRKTARLIGEKLNGRLKSIYQDIDPGEETVRNDLVKRLLTTGASEDEVASALANVFHMSGKNRAAVFGATGQLLDIEGMNTDDVSMVRFITETADKMSGNTPVAFNTVPKLVLGGLTLPDIAILFERAGKYRGADSFDAAMAKAAKGLGGTFIEACKTFIEQVEMEEAKQAKALAFKAGLEARAASVSAVPYVTNDPEVEKAVQFLDRARMLVSRIFMAEDREAVSSEVSTQLEAMWTELDNHFDAIKATTKRPSDEVIGKYALTWLMISNALLTRLLSSDPTRGRILFWGAVHKLMGIRFRIETRNLQDGEWSKMELVHEYISQLDRYIAAEEDGYNIVNGEFEDILQKLMHARLVAAPKQYEAPLPPTEETWPIGHSPYVKDLLSRLYAEQTEKLRAYGIPDEILGKFSNLFTEYQRLRSGYPSMPFPVAMCTLVKKLMMPITVFVNFHRDLSRKLATLPEAEFERYKREIARDFPEAIYYRNGLKQEIDTQEIKNALAYPESGEKLIMHICVGSDISFVKESLKHLAPDGMVVVVDISANALKPFNDDTDPEIRDARSNKKLIIIEADAFKEGDGAFKYDKDYFHKVTRLYLLHPSGTTTSTIDDLISQNGMVVWQTDNRPPKSDYWMYYELVVKGNFKKIIHYTNGPAWFQTDTAVDLLSGAGIHLLIARRKK